MEIKPLDGRSYAEQALVNFADRSRLFIDRDRASDFSRDYTPSQQNDIFADGSFPEEARNGDQEISSDSEFGRADSGGHLNRRTASASLLQQEDELVSSAAGSNSWDVRD